MGRSKDFSCTFDWIIKPANALKIAEGNYKNNNGGKNEPECGSTEYWQALAGN